MRSRILSSRSGAVGLRSRRSTGGLVWTRGPAPAAINLQCRACSQNALVKEVEKRPSWLGIRWVPADKPGEASRALAEVSAGEAAVSAVLDSEADVSAVPKEKVQAAAAADEQAGATALATHEDALANTTSRFGLEDNVRALLEFATADEVVDGALEVASRQELHCWWGDVTEKLRELELDALQAIVVLHCFVRMGFYDKALLSKVVDRIESRYFSLELGVVEHPALHRLLPMHLLSVGDVPATFQSIIAALPTSYKVKMILMDDFSRPDGRFHPPRPRPEPDAKKKWKTLEPIEMELEERKQFEKGRIRVKRVRHVEARVTRMRAGNRLRATLGLQLCQMLPEASLETLAEISQVCVFSKYRFLHGDFLNDFQESLSKRVDSLDTSEVRLYLLAFTTAMRDFGGSCAMRAWRRKLLPAVVQLTRSPRVLELLDAQLGFHPQLSGAREVQRNHGEGEAEAAEVRLLQSRAQRAAKLFVSLATARAVALDIELFDGLVAPLQDMIPRWCETAGSVGPTAICELLLPFEVLADSLDACVACGVSGVGAGAFPEMLAQLFLTQFRSDIEEGDMKLAAYQMKDVAVIAHAVALLCSSGATSMEEGLAEKVLGLLWEVSVARLQETEPHLTFMLLNALVRAGSEALLTSRPLIEAVDKHLAQRLDYNAAALGRLGS